MCMCMSVWMFQVFLIWVSRTVLLKVVAHTIRRYKLKLPVYYSRSYNLGYLNRFGHWAKTICKFSGTRPDPPLRADFLGGGDLVTFLEHWISVVFALTLIIDIIIRGFKFTPSLIDSIRSLHDDFTNLSPSSSSAMYILVIEFFFLNIIHYDIVKWW